MTTKPTVVPSGGLYAMLFEAGLVPAQATDIIIEIPLGGVVKIHCAYFPGDTLPKVMSAFAQSARVAEVEPDGGL